MGGSNPDLNNITSYIDSWYEKRQDCFSDFIKVGDWNKATSSDVRIAFNKMIVTKNKNPINPISYEFFPIKKNPSDRIFNFSNISLRNLEHGQVTNKEELLAGVTPTSAVFDEVGKFKYSKQRAALLPAIENEEGEKRFVEFLMGTGGNVENAINAESDFLDTDTSGFLHCDPDDYRKVVKPEYFQYIQESDKKVSLFVPAQMSNKGGKKIEVPLSEYLNRSFTEEELQDLEGLTILVTDWENATEKINTHIANEIKKDEETGKKTQMYYPTQPEHCFLYSDKNPFPAEEARKRRDFLKSTGQTGEYVELTLSPTGQIGVVQSDLSPITDYPFKGGAKSAPIVIYERPIFEDPRMIKKGTNIAGFDGVKMAVSDNSDSVNYLNIFKRIAGVSGYQNRIVASYASRPHMDKEYYRQAMLLLMLYNAEVLPESDVNFTKYLRQNKAEHLLAAAKGTNLRINDKSTANSDYGLPATTKNKQHLLKLVKDYCWEQIDTGQVGPDGESIMVLGIHRIDDVMLLEEIIKFGSIKNYDRIMSFGHTLIWDEELTINGIQGSEEKAQQYYRQQERISKGSKGRNRKYIRRR